MFDAGSSRQRLLLIVAVVVMTIIGDVDIIVVVCIRVDIRSVGWIRRRRCEEGGFDCLSAELDEISTISAASGTSIVVSTRVIITTVVITTNATTN